jgi:hypothetical protein
MALRKKLIIGTLVGILALTGCKPKTEHKKIIEISSINKIEYRYNRPLNECHSYSEFADKDNLKVIESHTDYQFATFHMRRGATWKDIELYMKNTGEKLKKETPSDFRGGVW